MTKVNLERKTQYKDILNDLEEGDFFLDEKNHLCMFVEHESEGLDEFYDFHSQVMRCLSTMTDITYLNEVYITY
jgi:hypothetical protein